MKNQIRDPEQTNHRRFGVGEGIDIASLCRTRLLCVGDVMLDRFVTGDVERVSREAPIPVLRVTGQRAVLGGAANVARNLAVLGVKTDFVCVVGEDAVSDEIIALLNAQKGLTPHIVTQGRTTRDSQNALYRR